VPLREESYTVNRNLPIYVRRVSCLVACALLFALACPAQSAHPDRPLGPGYSAWLTYLPVQPAQVFGAAANVPDTIVVLGQSEVEKSAGHELARGWHGMLGRIPRVQTGASAAGDAADKNTSDKIVVVGTQAEVRAWRPALASGPALPADGYRLLRAGNVLLVEGGDARGALYGAFALLREIAQEHSLAALDLRSQPANAIRWTNEWDNPNGTIERGYAGPSIFFEDGHIRADLSRAAAYARLLASVGIDGCTINNVNADPRLLEPENIAGIARIADLFRPWGVRISISIDMSSPQKVGGLSTFDPLDPQVSAWWHDRVEEIYRAIPDFGGVVIKADSEGKPGPSQYGRSPADAANVLARALAPHGGLVLYRGFVYNNHLDWRDMKADRARAGYDNFHNLDGKFLPNVIVQIKYGPIDFQVREPVSPLFDALPHTNEAIELQITQEYTGQQRHLVYLAPMWKISLDTDMRASTSAPPLTVADLISGKPIQGLKHNLGGFIGVANVGTERWLGHPLALANLYSFGRLAWNPAMNAAAISDEWTRLTFGNDPEVRQVVNKLEMDSWHIYESYTGPLGVGTLTDIIGIHFGPGIESAERNGWGQWIRADNKGIGMDRTVATGTGYIGQYPKPLRDEYESLKSCPDNLLLFMHHVPYNYRLHDGKTVVQYVYDTHYWGAQAAAEQIPAWESLHGKVPDAIYAETLKRLTFQVGHAIVWRDAVTKWFQKMSGIPDDRHRVDNYPNRIEAESMQLDGYTPVDVKPWETAGGGKAVTCDADQCSLSTTWQKPDGWYDIAAQYFDFKDGESQYTLDVAGRTVEQWKADANLPDDRINGNTSTRHTIHGVALHRGDVLRLVGRPDGKEPAPVDYIEVTPIANATQVGSRK
jgi:alpha-glucuronidase